MSADNKIHVAFGFHVNCYHSYRGDTNDGLGFGSDIRIIRKILDTVCEISGKKYGSDKEDDVSIRIITDHILDLSLYEDRVEKLVELI